MADPTRPSCAELMHYGGPRCSASSPSAFPPDHGLGYGEENARVRHQSCPAARCQNLTFPGDFGRSRSRVTREDVRRGKDEAPEALGAVGSKGRQSGEGSVGGAMSFPDIDITISFPRELTSVLRAAKQCLAQGTLRQIRAVDSPYPLVALDDLSAVPDEGPWPDVILAYFDGSGGQRYELSADTYHGSGGSWRPI